MKVSKVRNRENLALQCPTPDIHSHTDYYNNTLAMHSAIGLITKAAKLDN